MPSRRLLLAALLGALSLVPRLANATCDGIPANGCCDQNTLKYCKSDDTVAVVNCGSLNGDPNAPRNTCLWNYTDTAYECGDPNDVGTYTTQDPGQWPIRSAQPKACPTLAGACIPDCAGKVCGDDGCGGSCGSCRTGYTCDAPSGTCVKDSEVGNCQLALANGGCCQGNVFKGCSFDGSIYAVNCDASASNKTCGKALGGGGFPGGPGGGSSGGCYSPSEFPAPLAECVAQCTPRCDGTTCDDGCGSICPGCFGCDPHRMSCPCIGSCTGKECGSDGCFDTCGTCPAGKLCDPSGRCIALCRPSCDGKECGSDGCGGSCGTCPSGEYCGPGGACRATCIPDCSGKMCGDDGCGGSCGTCPSGASCDSTTHQCLSTACPEVPLDGCCAGSTLVTCNRNTGRVTARICSGSNPATACAWSSGSGKYACGGNTPTDPLNRALRNCPATLCIPVCDGKSCGDDGCGGSCGTCPGGTACQGGVCKATCVPACTGKACGDDGCGGSCGSCGSGLTCTPAGQCRADPCHGVPATGCCEGRTLKKCEAQGTVTVSDCTGTAEGYCGWDDAAKAYSCDAGYANLDSSKPFACPGAPTCTPKCNGRKCGPDGCGGTCGTCDVAHGETCNDKSGACVKPCDGVPTYGCCDGMGTVKTCPGVSAGPNDAVITNCPTYRGQYMETCGWSNKDQRFKCGGLDRAPADKYGSCPAPAKKCDCKDPTYGYAWTCGDDGCGGSCGTCPAGKLCGSAHQCQTCYPSCGSRQCGDDGCGGSCGTCPGASTCGTDGKCVVAACGSTTSKGTCSGSTLTYCTAFELETVDCSTQGLACGWVGSEGRNSCVPATSAQGANTCTATDCGVEASSSRACQCDAQCAERGDCCANYEPLCGAKVAATSCGDGTCDPGRGESCESCPADCQCENPSSELPPWAPPYDAIGVAAKQPDQHMAVNALPTDDVRPAGPPYPLRGLVARVPQLGVNAGDPSTSVQATHARFLYDYDPPPNVTVGTPAATTTSRHGAGIGFTKSDGTSNAGLLSIIPRELFPKAPSWGLHEPGGATLAFWLKVPKTSLANTNPIASTDGGYEACGWTRPKDSVTTVSCGSAWYNTIRAVQVYWGSVANARPPDGQCNTFRKMEPTYACSDASVQQKIEKACIGKTSCSLDALNLGADPCGTASNSPPEATLMVRAICGGTGQAPATLLVESTRDGQHLRLDVPGMPSLRTKQLIQPDTWTHVAVTFAPRESGRGRAALYVDGGLDGENDNFAFPAAAAWNLGAGYVNGATRSTPNWIGQDVVKYPRNVAGIGEVDDVFLYDRALAVEELSAVRDAAENSVVRVWPALDAERIVRRKLWTTGGTASLARLEVANLRDPFRTADTAARLAADFRGISLGSGITHATSTTDADLKNLSDFTLAGWVRLPTLADGKTIVTLKQGTSTELALKVSGCNGTGLTGQRSTTPAVTNCNHGFVAGEWAFVSYTQQGSTQTVAIDGYPTATVSSAQALFGGTDARTFTIGDGVDLGWMALFDRALTRSELQAARITGPSVWLDGAAYLPGGASARLPRDYAGFHDNASGTRGDTAQVWKSGGSPLAAADSSHAFGAGASYATIPARGRLDPSRPFTVSETLKVSVGELTTPVRYDLVTAGDGSQRVFSAQLVCRPSCTRTDPSCRRAVPVCHVEMEGRPASGGGAKKWASEDQELVRGAPSGTMVHVAVAWDPATAPRVAIDFALEQPLERNPANSLPTVSLTGTVTSAAALANVPASLQGAQFYLPGVLPSGTPSFGASVAYSDLRLYDRALGGGELVAITRQTCSQIGCEAQSRQCVGKKWGDGSWRAACGACTGAGDTSELGGACVAKNGFATACAGPSDCKSGLCSGGICAAASDDAVCDSSCAGLGRTCVSAPNDGGYVCSSDCRSFFRKSSASDGKESCAWQPTLWDGDQCGPVWETKYASDGSSSLVRAERGDLACRSGSCANVTEPDYEVKTTSTYVPEHGGEYPSNPERRLITCASLTSGCAVPEDKTRALGQVCASPDARICEDRHMEPVAHVVDLPGSGEVTRYTCEGCSKETYAGLPVYKQAWTMMSPAACKLIYDNYTFLLASLRVDKNILRQQPSLKALRQLVLLDDKPDSPITPKQFAQLQQRGIGPVLLGWERLPYSERVKYAGTAYETGAADTEKLGVLDADMRHLEIGDCNKQWFKRYKKPGYAADYFPDLLSAFEDHSLNRPICVPNRFPDGTPCPTPGVTPVLDRAHAGNTCESGFCAVDTGVCEEGYNAFETNEGGDENNAQKGGGDNDLGPIQLIQTNRTVMTAKKNGAQTGTDKRAYSMASSNVYGVNLFGLMQVDVLKIGTALAANMGQGDATFSQVAQVFGLDIPPDPPKASSCGAAEWKNGEYQKPNCSPPRNSQGLIDSGKTGTVTMTVPLPGQECESVYKGKKLAKGAKRGPLCFEQTTFVGPVPFTVKAAVELAAKLEFGAEIDSDTMEPSLKVAPGLELGLDVRGGVGKDLGVAEVFAGIHAAITMVEISFPITWSLKLESISDSADKVISDLYRLSFQRNVQIVLTFLKLQLSLFFEVSVGFVSKSWDFDLFGFDGIVVSQDLSSDNLWQKKLDFQWVAEAAQ